MNTTTAPEVSGDALLQQHEPLAGGFPAGSQGRFLYGLALAFSTFQIATAAHVIDLASQIVRAVHVGFLLALIFPLMSVARRDSLPLRVISWMACLIAVALAAYQWIEYNALILRAGDPNQVDLVVGVTLLVLLFVATWRVMGPALPIISGTFLAYCLLGEYLPAPLNHRGYAFTQVIDHMAFGTEGVYGIPTYVSSSYIFLFILFGAFLEKAGMISLFTDIALGLFGSRRGGPAKVAVVASGLMGMISGSGVANVVTTGQFTIPLMIRFGYKRAFAGGVEATASMGGQIMPPVMGAVAFIMAETLDVPYATIVKAAVVPAVLYFMSAFWMVHLEAGRAGLAGLAEADLPSPMRALKERWYLILPLMVLVALLFSGYTPLFAGTVGLALTVMLILGGS
ncbi:MAG: TRAP transporter fused permease subunit, partial [Ideonella sp.]